MTPYSSSDPIQVPQSQMEMRLCQTANLVSDSKLGVNSCGVFLTATYPTYSEPFTLARLKPESRVRA